VSNPWFRMYSEFATDAKVQSMSEAMQRRLLMLFCLRCSNVLATLHDDELTFALRLSADELAETKALFVRKRFIDDAWNLQNWDKRQFNSDSSTARSKKHREKKQLLTKSATKQTVAATPCNVAATVPDTDTDTDTEEKQKREPRALASEAVPDPTPPRQPSPEGDTCRRLIKLGIPQVNPSHPALLDLLRDGATPEGIEQTAAELAQRGRAPGFKLVLATVRGRMEDVAAGITTGRGIRAPPTRATISTPLPEPGSYGQSDIPDDWTPAQAAS